MAYLSGIIERTENHFHVKIHGNYQKKYTIDGIHFLTDNDVAVYHLCPNILYLASYSKYGSAALSGDILFTG